MKICTGVVPGLQAMGEEHCNARKLRAYVPIMIHRVKMQDLNVLSTLTLINAHEIKLNRN